MVLIIIFVQGGQISMFFIGNFHNYKGCKNFFLHKYQSKGSGTGSRKNLTFVNSLTIKFILNEINRD